MVDLCLKWVMTNLQARRMYEGYTQFEVVALLAEKQGVKTSTCWLSLLENGHRKPTDKLLKSLAELYGVGVSALKGDFVLNASEAVSEAVA